MPIQPEVLERLKVLPPLNCDTRLFSWPVQKRSDCLELYKEFARISKSWPSSSKVGTDWERDMEVCHASDAKICFHNSPPVPLDNNWEAARDEYTNRWKVVQDNLDLSLVEVAYIDLEQFKYVYPANLTDEKVQHNNAVRSYNLEVYRIAKAFLGDSVPVRRYSHLATGFNPNHNYGEYKVSGNTCWTDPVDGGWGVSWYRPMNWPHDLRNLEATIQTGRQHGVQEGTVWATVGCSLILWQCPGVSHPYETVTGDIVAWPYDPSKSHYIGSLFGSNHWIKEIHGDDYRNDTYPPMKKVHSVCIWPGVFHTKMDKTAVHLAAFLEGMSSRTFDSTLRELQVAALSL